ncbi:hypothetical protein K1719_008790 [Acacia pycnantha]|nr:hypothetical protein K1719_008790 [Acacia pycnantha]
MLLQFFIWTAYLLADWAANNTAGGGGNHDDANKEILMALWAPFVLLHFGGPDTITAFSLEDNQLWLRQLPGLLFQVGASAYVFLLSLPRNTMWVPTLLVFVAGLIKCFERTRALYIANKNLGRGPKIWQYHIALSTNLAASAKTSSHVRQGIQSDMWSENMKHPLLRKTLRKKKHI